MNRFLFIGLNYNHMQTRNIDCIANVYKLKEYLQYNYNIKINPEDILTDSTNIANTTHQAILARLYQLGLDTWNDDIKNIFIYYTGDSIDIHEYIGGYNVKQGIVPSDYHLNGIIDKKQMSEIFCKYNPKTHITFIMDCCLTVENPLNLKYTWDVKNDAFAITDISSPTARRITTLSYSIDKYAVRMDDNFFHTLNMNERIHSYADYIAKLDNRNNNNFELLQDIYEIFKKKKINMKPVLCSTFIHTDNDKLFDYLADSFEDYKRRSYVAINISQQPVHSMYHEECYC